MRRRLSWPVRLALIPIALIFLLFAWAVIARQLAPRANTTLTHFDAIIVWVLAVDRAGNPTPDELARVLEAVHEYERGVAPRMILSGGAVSNRFVEAQVMARTAEAQGIPPSAIIEEGRSRDTIQNACNSDGIMQAYGWHSAEVVSGARHLPRAALIFGRLPLEWRMHAAPPLEIESPIDAAKEEITEILKTVRYLGWNRQIEQCEP